MCVERNSSAKFGANLRLMAKLETDIFFFQCCVKVDFAMKVQDACKGLDEANSDLKKKSHQFIFCTIFFFGSQKHKQKQLSLFTRAANVTNYVTFVSGGAFGRSPPTNLMLTELTQWRSFVWVKPSPVKTWPRWPPHRAHTISVRTDPKERSTLVFSAPANVLSKAGQPQPESNFAFAEYSGLSHARHAKYPPFG
mmetsp:Transcript_4981/g.13420  ORF Transcript_4981/g.13420 Transcript_4981/m.13420 type:complete len:195 (+) Transcript_4981:1981-2565(+)